jgi:inorganic pyrophosphatase
MLKNTVFSLRKANVRNFSRVFLNSEKTLSYESIRSDDKRERHYLVHNDKKISPWHDLALKPEASELDVFNTVIEITRNTTSKMEVETTKEHNPIVQDQKKNAEGVKIDRHYGLIPGFNYGMIPQTWENAQHTHQETGLIGDNDPLDVVCLTPRDMQMYELPLMKVIGCLCLIDQGELDWKILAVEDSYAQEFNIRDEYTFTQRNPGAISEVINWMRTYKTYDGKKENSFGYDDKVLSVEKTIEIIFENHEYYKELMAGKIENIDNLYLNKK